MKTFLLVVVLFASACVGPRLSGSAGGVAVGIKDRVAEVCEGQLCYLRCSGNQALNGNLSVTGTAGAATGTVTARRFLGTPDQIPYAFAGTSFFTTSGMNMTVGGNLQFYINGTPAVTINGGTFLATFAAKVDVQNNSGTITLAAGSGSATVTAGARCVCQDTTASALVRCSVAATTLSASGTGSDVISYFCDR